MPDDPTGDLQALRASTADLLQELDSGGWSDADLAAPSLCPGWSRGHVLTHLARNADGIAATVAGALRGEQVARYPGGDAQRDGDIEAGAGRPFGVVVSDLRDACAKLDRVLGAVHDAAGWELATAEGHTVATWLFRRLREVEIHRVDLDSGYGPRRWPPRLVASLPDELGSATLPPDTAWQVTVTGECVVPDLLGRSWTLGGAGTAVEVAGPDWALLAWLVGRGATVADVLPSPPPPA